MLHMATLMQDVSASKTASILQWLDAADMPLIPQQVVGGKSLSAEVPSTITKPSGKAKDKVCGHRRRHLCNAMMWRCHLFLVWYADVCTSSCEVDGR